MLCPLGAFILPPSTDLEEKGEEEGDEGDASGVLPSTDQAGASSSSVPNPEVPPPPPHSVYDFYFLFVLYFCWVSKPL